MIILETDRLLLRHYESSDIAALDALYRDPEVRRYIPDYPRTYADTVAELEWFSHGHPRHPELGLWATIEKATGRFIGRCGLIPWTIAGQDEVEVAYLLERAAWGQGLGTEVARALVAYGFEVLHLPRLVCLVDEGNTASIRVAEKAGMRFEKTGADEQGPFLLYAQFSHTD